MKASLNKKQYCTAAKLKHSRSTLTPTRSSDSLANTKKTIFTGIVRNVNAIFCKRLFDEPSRFNIICLQQFITLSGVVSFFPVNVWLTGLSPIFYFTHTPKKNLESLLIPISIGIKHS